MADVRFFLVCLCLVCGVGNVASGTVKKVIEINKFLLGTMAGGAGTFFHSFPFTHVMLFPSSHSLTPSLPPLWLRSGLSILGNLFRYPMSFTRIEEQGEDLSSGCF